MAIAGRVAIVPKGDWSADATYKRLDAVTYNNALFIAKKEVSVGILPTNIEYWMKSIDGSQTIPNATKTQDGLMSKEDKTKIDDFKQYKPDGKTITADEDGTLHGVAKVTVDDALSPTSTNPVQNKVVKGAVDELKQGLGIGSARIDELNQNLGVERARIDSLTKLPEGSTTGDAELQDIRVKADGTTATSAGNAVREQVGELKSDLVNIGQDFRSDNLININDMVKGGWIENNGSVSYYDGYNCTQFIDVSGHRGERIHFSENGNYGSGYTARRIAEYDSSKQFIKISKEVSFVDLTENTVFVRVGMEDKNTFPKLNFKLEDLTYRDYYVPQLPKMKDDILKSSKWNGLSITVEKPWFERKFSVNEGYFKCERIIIMHKNMPTYAGTWEVDIIRSDNNPNGIWVVDSAQLVKQCAFIGGEDNQKLVYSFTEKIIKYSTADTFDANTLVLLALDGGILHGALAEYITQYIEQKYVSHRYRKCNEVIVNNHIIPKVTNVIKNIHSNGITFGYFSDNHGRSDMDGYPNLTPKYLNKVDELVNLDFILNAGDIIASSNTFTIENALYSIATQNSEFNNASKQIIAIGNHDQNGHTEEENQKLSWTVTHKMFFNSCYRHLENDKDVVWGSKEDLYFYKDFVDKKIRVIVLNTQDCGEATKTVDGVECLKHDSLITVGLRQEQMNWLANTALKFSYDDKNEWHTLVCCHVGLRSGITDNHPSVQNSNAIDSILRAFKNGTNVNVTYTDTTNEDGLFTVDVSADYRNQGAMPLIGVFSGHNHCDRVYTENYPQVTILAGYPAKGYDSINREIETKNEFAFDVVSVDKVARKVTLTRFGAGSDREYTY